MDGLAGRCERLEAEIQTLRSEIGRTRFVLGHMWLALVHDSWDEDEFGEIATVVREVLGWRDEVDEGRWRRWEDYEDIGDEDDPETGWIPDYE